MKKIGVKLMGIFIFLFIGINLFFYYTRLNPGSTMSGMFISDLPAGINLSLVAFISQWVILLLIVVFAYMRFLKHHQEENQKITGFIIPEPQSKAQTTIDIFYNLLKEKKSLTTGTIAKAFKITKDQALEWAKILEEHNLVLIEYPAFADPEIKIAGYNEEKLKQKELQKKIKETKSQEKNKPIDKEQQKQIPEKNLTKEQTEKK